MYLSAAHDVVVESAAALHQPAVSTALLRHLPRAHDQQHIPIKLESTRRKPQ